MASREELLQSIGPDMRLDKWFFLRIYGYEITWPGFAEVALQRLEIMGCSKARNYYEVALQRLEIMGCSKARNYYSCIVAEYEHNREEELKEVASWYAEECRKQWDRKVGEEIRIRKESLRRLQQNSMRS